MYAANNEGINILGAILCRLSGTDKLGRKIGTGEMIYVSDSTNLFYLSHHAMTQLQIIDSHFPQIGAHSSISGVCINNQETDLCGSSENVGQPHGVPHWGRFWGGSKYDYKIQVAIKKRLTVKK